MGFKRSPERPLIWGHRGASGYAPENTLPSFALAAEMKADGVELDVQLTKDGELVVIHDEMIDRTSNGKGLVKDLTLAQLREYNYNNHNPKYEHVDIPTLREVYELLKPTGLTINVELKNSIFPYPGMEEKLLALTAEMEMEDRVLYSTFNHYSCVKLRQLKPDAYIGFLYGDKFIDIASYAKKHGGDALHPLFCFLADPGYMESTRENGLDVNAWTINEPEYIELAKQLGINAIITNYPDRARAICCQE